MNDVFDYIEWRGDISMAENPVNDVDMLILCRLSYIPFDGAVSQSFNAPVTLGAACRAVLDFADNIGTELARKEDRRLLAALSESPRFEGISLCAYTVIYSEDTDEQFAALTCLLGDGTVAVIFRGTDATIVGWKEDFNLCFLPEIPAQKDAVAYLSRTAEYFRDKKIRVAGHSKGGNLSMYASALCRPEIQSRIIAVRNLDGPGFNEFQSCADGFARVSGVTLTYLPDSSVIGMLLGHTENSTIVESQSMGLFQHNMYMWKIRRAGFITKDGRTESSHIIDRTLKQWLSSLTREQREKMIDGLFRVLQSSDGNTLGDLLKSKNGIAVFSTFVKLDPETRENIDIGMRLLKESLKNNIRAERAVEKIINEN